jgi:hypothetical protein
MAWHSTSASRVPARPPERELMNTSSGLSGSAEPRNCLVPRRYSCGILWAASCGWQGIPHSWLKRRVTTLE